MHYCPTTIYPPVLRSLALVVFLLGVAYPLTAARSAASSSTAALTGQPPVAPANPRPADGAIDVLRKLYLDWSWGDPDSPTNEFDVYFGISSPPPMVATVPYNLYTPAGPFPLGALEPSRKYYWRVVARDPEGNTTAGPIWSFTTIAPSPPAPTPYNPSPPDHATNVPLSGLPLYALLSWSSSPNPATPGGFFYYRYDVYFGTDPSPPKVATNITSPGYGVGGLRQTTDYYWRVVTRDVDGYETTGPTWTFRTKVNPNNNITLGLYADAQGTSCALSDAGGPGMRTVFVVLNGPTSVSSCRFAAPIPSCFAATWLGDDTPYTSIGESPVDVSVAFGACLAPPIHVMSIYYLSNGTTQGCCSFPTGYTARLAVTDCSFVELDVRNFPVLGISADGSCPSCGPVAIRPTTWGALKALYR